MRIAMTVPTYWSRPSNEGWQEGDLVFDHPTPLDGEDTLGRLLTSLSVLEDTRFELALVVVPTTPEIESEALGRVNEIVLTDLPEGVNPPKILAPRHLNRLGGRLGTEAVRYSAFLNLAGYAQVRNGCLLAALLLKADAVLLIDDDEIIEDPSFLRKVGHGLKLRHAGKQVVSLAGYYVNPDGGYLSRKPFPEWGVRWPKYSVMDSAFLEFIGRAPRYKPVPFAFGGNLALHRQLFSALPFDIRVTRGEDLDYVMMAMMSGAPTILDNELAIKHAAPPKSHPLWRQMRQDVIRFVYQRAKLRAESTGGLRKLGPEDFDPYPGFFLRGDLDQRIAETSSMLAEHYRVRDDDEAAEQAMRNMEIAAQAEDPSALAAFIELREAWKEFIKAVEGIGFDDLAG
jgi:glycosyltransferase involved in cell wall biosynthesis